MQSCPVRVIARVRREAPGAPSSSCLLVQPTRLIVQPFVAALASAAAPGGVSPRTSPRRNSVTGGGSRKSSMGCSSLVPRTPHTPRGLLRNVLSVFPVMEEAGVQEEVFAVSAALGESAGQEEVFASVLSEIRAVLSGHRSTLLAYGVAESGKSYTLWGTEHDKGLVPRALEYLFAHAPPGTRVTLSLVGLDDTSAVDYLGEGSSLANPQFRDLIDGSKGLARGTTAVAESAAAAWDAVLEGLSRAVSSRHLILTVSVVVPCGDAQESSLLGTLQVAELALPGPSERMSRNLSTLHDIVRGLVDKTFTGTVDYSGSLLTTILQPAFGGNSRTSVLLTLHPSISQFHHTVETLSFGEHCAKLKNVIAPVRVAGVRPAAAVDAPAEMLHQLKDLRQYADEVDLENDDLRQRLAVWATRYEEMKRRHELALQREQESCRTRVASADADMASMALQLQQALVNCESQELTMSNLRMQMVRRAPEDLAEVERSVAAENDKLRQTIAGLKQRPEGRAGPELKEQLVALQRETDALRAALAAYEAAPSVAAVVAAAPAVPSSGLLREKDAQLEAMNQEMDRKEQEMAEREQKIEELEDQVNFLKSQIHTINFLKASVIPGVQQRVVMAAPVAPAPAPARKAAKTVAPSEEAVAATKARAKEQVAARLRKKEEERARKAAAEDEAQVVADMRREQERQEKEARARAKKQREQEAREKRKRQQAAKPPTPPPAPRPVAEMQAEEEQEEEEVVEEEEEVVAQPPPRKSSQKKQKRASPVVEEEPEAVVEEPVPTPLPARGKKVSRKTKPVAAAAAPPPPVPKSPMPALKKRVPSPNENVPAAGDDAEQPAQKRGRKKLYNGAEKKTRKPEFRKSLAPTPSSAGTGRRQARAGALGRLDGGADYASMLDSVLENNLYAVQTPGK